MTEGNIPKRFIFNLYKLFVNLLWGTDISRYSFVRKTSKLIIEKFKPEKVCLDGFDIYLDKKDILGLCTVGFKQNSHVYMMLKKFVRKNDIAVDVGAHIGVESLYLSRLVGNKGHVFSFEPETTNFQILKKNVEKNDLKNVTLLNKAVGDKTTEHLFVLGPDSASHKLVEKPNSQEAISVKCTRLEDVTKKIDFAKIDAEGFDFHVLLGMGNLINNPDLRIIIEFWPKGLREGGTDPVKMLEFLQENSFKIFNVPRQSRMFIPVTDFNKFTEKYSKGKLYATELFCIKNSDQISFNVA